MALTAEQARKALIAFNRFGLGAKPGGPEAIGANPEQFLRDEVNTAGIAEIDNPSLPGYVIACRDSQMGFEAAETIRAAEMMARVSKHMAANIGFVERLVLFWSNHFSMTVNKNETLRGTIGHWEREIVRKHTLGKFHDMLRRTMNHPAMVSYLDNEDSIGPNSEIGQQWGAGYNENLAREILELHTLGSASGRYTERDVTKFALILTGWSYVRGWEADGRYNGGNPNNRGQFLYRRTWHQPGTIRILGKDYAPGANGKAQAEAVLEDLAANDATAEHIAFKLVHHFITDEPTPAMVDPIKNAYLTSGGDLKAVALALIDLPEAWSMPLRKLRTPYEMTIAQYRAMGERYRGNEGWVLSEPLYALHHMAWEAPTPKGWSDDTLTWLNPDAMRLRLDIAQFTSWWFKSNYAQVSAVTLGRDLFDVALSADTRSRLQNASSGNDALTMLLTCPEFQRR